MTRVTGNGGGSFRPAERTQVKLKIGIHGPSGSGKTKGAIALATHLVPDGRVAVLDTENHSSSFYADDYNFVVANLAPPFTTQRYLQLIQEAIAAGIDVLVIDSITHEWAGTGGILERKDELDRRPGSNSYANWNDFTREHNKFVSEILQAPIHIICTMRSKQDYALEQRNGKAVPVKIGMAPIQRDGVDYEFGLLLDVQMDHRAKVAKKRIDVLDTEALYDLCAPKVAGILRDWLKSGKPMLAQETAAAEEEAETAPITLNEAEVMPLMGPPGSWGGLAGKPLGGFSTYQLEQILEFIRGSYDKRPTEEKARTIAASELIIEARRQREEAKAPTTDGDIELVPEGQDAGSDEEEAVPEEVTA